LSIENSDFGIWFEKCKVYSDFGIKKIKFPIAKARKKQYNKDRRNQKRGAADGEE
jgi:hypothetical protein